MICVDMHCDSVSEAFVTGRSLVKPCVNGHSDLPRLRLAGIKVQFFALFPDRIYHPSAPSIRSPPAGLRNGSIPG